MPSPAGQPWGTTPGRPCIRRCGATGWDVTADGEFYMPTRALFGRGIAGQVAEHVAALGGAGGVLLVTDPGVRAAGLVAPVEAALTGSGITVSIFDQVRPNPRDTDCLAGAELMRSGGQRRWSRSAAGRRSTQPSASACCSPTAGIRGTGRTSARCSTIRSRSSRSRPRPGPAARSARPRSSPTPCARRR